MPQVPGILNQIFSDWQPPCDDTPDDDTLVDDTPDDDTAVHDTPYGGEEESKESSSRKKTRHNNSIGDSSDSIGES